MLRQAWRRLWATPVFAIFAVVSLALGVGVTTALYSVILSLTSNSLAVPNADRIVMMVGADPYGRRPTWRSALSRADFEDLRATAHGMGELAASAVFYQSVVDTTVSEIATGEAVTGNYFVSLGLAPGLGRLIQPSDDATGGRLVVLSHRFWRTRFGADPGIVGRALRIGGQPFEVVGVAPESFDGLNDQMQVFTSLWVPLASTDEFPSGAAPPKDPADRRRRQLSVFAVMPADRSPDALSAEMAAIGERLDAAYPIDLQINDTAAVQRHPRGWTVKTLDAAAAEQSDRITAVTTGVTTLVGLVIVVACTNLANLVLARGSSRVHELAVRRALGASRARLMWDQLAESVLIAVVGALGALGALGVARVLMVWFTSANLPISQAQVVQLEPQLNLPTLGIAAVSMMASLAVFGLAPAWQLTRVQLRPVLSTEGGSTGHSRWRTRRTLIALQVAISVAFLLITAFGARVVMADRAQPSGIDLDRLVIGQLNFRLPPWNEPRAREALDRMLASGAPPGLTAVAVASGMPFGLPGTPVASVTSIDRPFLPGHDDYPYAPLLASSPSIFQTLGVAIVRGRGFDARDTLGAEPVAVLSQRTAIQVFGTSDVVGRQVFLRNSINMSGGPEARLLSVIGVTSDTDAERRHARGAGVVYLPLAQHYEPSLVLVGRADGDPAQAIAPLKALVRRADPDLVLDRPVAAAGLLTGAYVLVGIVSRVAGGLATLALVLAMAGLFGVLSHVVSRRTREMGVRMALGADPPRLRRLVLGDGLRPVAGGVLVGLLAGVLVRLIMQSEFNSPITATDALIFVIAPLPILFAALVACDWPARRASRVDPNVALRDL